MAEARRSRDEFLDAGEEEPIGLDQVDEQVQRAQERLLQLKRQAEQLEKEKQKLEELSRRQNELEQGRRDLGDKFTRALVVIQRETDQCIKRLELLKAVHEDFAVRLQELEAIDPSSWPAAEMNKELSRALSTVEDARSEFTKAYARIAPPEESAAGSAVFDDEGPGPAEGHTFTYWLMAGFAFTLPLFGLGLLGLVLWFLQLSAR